MTSKLCVIVLALVGVNLAQSKAETPKTSSSAKTGTCANPEPTPEDCSKSGICSLPVASPEELLDSLDVALKPLGNRYGFPAEVIAASYGIQDPGWKCAWKLWRFRSAPIQKTFETL